MRSIFLNKNAQHTVKSTVKITPLKAILKKILFRICLYEHFKEGNYKIPNFCISGINGLMCVRKTSKGIFHRAREELDMRE